MNFTQQDAKKHDSSTLGLNILLSIFFSSTDILSSSLNVRDTI
jgi:hypothetical protein